jgi:ABC-type sulfate transport system permease component
MLWFRVIVILLAIATVVCVGYDFHLHLHNATHDEVMDATMLTLLFGAMTTVLAVVESRYRRQ